MAKGTVTNRTAAEPRVRRGYFESRFGQLHVHNAIPPGGGFEEGTPLLCIHQTAGSGRVPAAFNNLVGLKPTRGLLSLTGVVPACRSLDCISIFATNCREARGVRSQRKIHQAGGNRHR